MIRVMLVDDEPFTRVAIKTLFDWEGHGFRIVAEANNGESALLKLKYEQPDLIVTDMRMPITDGASFIKQVKTRYPLIKCIALSNYDDFGLARSAFLEGAEDYLLKSDLTGENASALEACLGKLFPGNAQSRIAAGADRRGAADKDRRAAALREALENGEELGAESGLETGRPFVVAKLSIDLGHIPAPPDERDSAGERLVASTVLKIVSEISEFETCCYSAAPDEYVILVYEDGADDSAFFAKLEAFLGALWSNIEKFLNAYAVVGVSELKTGIGELRAAYAEAAVEAENIFYDSASGVYYRRSGGRGPAEAAEVFGEDIDGLAERVGDHDWDGIREVCTRLCDTIRTERFRPDYAKRIIVNLVFVLQGEALRRQARGWNDLPANEARIDGILRARSMSAISKIVAQFIDELKEKSDGWDAPRDEYSALIGRTVQHLNRSFRAPDTNLNTVADALQVNASYLSRFFHQETGTHFNAYLTNLRMVYSKNLLRTTKETVAAIAEKCGYPNHKYYFNLFKKLEGITPATYRNGGARPPDADGEA